MGDPNGGCDRQSPHTATDREREEREREKREGVDIAGQECKSQDIGGSGLQVTHEIRFTEIRVKILHSSAMYISFHTDKNRYYT